MRCQADLDQRTNFHNCATPSCQHQPDHPPHALAKIVARAYSDHESTGPGDKREWGMGGLPQSVLYTFICVCAISWLRGYPYCASLTTGRATNLLVQAACAEDAWNCRARSTVGRRDRRTKSSHVLSPGHHPEWSAQGGLGSTRPNCPSSALPRQRQFARGARATAKQVVNPARSFSRYKVYRLPVCGRRGEGLVPQGETTPGEGANL